MKICSVTIVSANYLAYAKVLHESIRSHFGASDFVTLVVDRRVDATVKAVQDLPFETLWIDELGLPDIDRIAFQFDILELNTALKPTLLKLLLARGYDAVVYWDPDIRLFAPPTPVVEALAAASIVLTPHALAPLFDGYRPSDIDLIRHGSYNLGFIAVRGDATGLRMLDWWEDRCLGHGFNDPAVGTFVDQKWLDLAPSYFDDVRILKHRGCNVAYWNLHERPIEQSHGGLTAGAEKLVFFHFSGVDANHPERLSKHQDRHRLDPGTELHSLVAAYCASLRSAGHAGYQRIAYTFDALSDGQPVSPLMRRALGCIGAAEPRPFDPSSAMHRRLRDAGIAGAAERQAASPREAKINSFNFDPGDRRVVWVNRLLRMTGRVIGLERLQMLLRYLNFLARGSNLAAVLTDTPFVLEHAPRKGGVATQPSHFPDAAPLQ